MKIDARVKLNRFGFYSLAEIPDPAKLKEYYATKFYQEPRETAYATKYADDEIRYFRNKAEQKHIALAPFLSTKSAAPRLLDVGCGEGWALKYFLEQGWRVRGLDFSDWGCRSHNPECLAHLTKGDVFDSLASLVTSRDRFDVLWLDNVLEHVVDPLALLVQCRSLLAPGGVLLVEVPNDFSLVQQALLERGDIDEAFWVCPPDHVSYFNAEGLTNLCREAGWKRETLLADFPIDWNLFNPDTNYSREKTKGKNCHRARVAVENLMHAQSPAKVVEWYRVGAELGIGRLITGIFRPAAG